MTEGVMANQPDLLRQTRDSFVHSPRGCLVSRVHGHQGEKGDVLVEVKSAVEAQSELAAQWELWNGVVWACVECHTTE